MNYSGNDSNVPSQAVASRGPGGVGWEVVLMLDTREIAGRRQAIGHNRRF